MIKSLIRDGVDHAERHDIGELMKLASDDFIASPGKINKNGTKGVLWRTFRYYKSFKILHPRPDIEVSEEGQFASARFPFLIVKEDHAFTKLNKLFDDPIKWIEEAGKSADVYRIKLDWKKNNKKWLVIRADVRKYS